MILAFDTYYYDGKAKTVCLEFEDWNDSTDFKIHVEILENIEEYVSGAFYKRELPCILSLLRQRGLNDLEAIVIDGFVFLDDQHKSGLGAHLYQELQCKIPVIGVAKTNFATIETHKRSLLRGNSAKPLFITAIGIDVDEAAKKIKDMDGAFRIPTLLKELDRLTKEL